MRLYDYLLLESSNKMEDGYDTGKRREATHEWNMKLSFTPFQNCCCEVYTFGIKVFVPDCPHLQLSGENSQHAAEPLSQGTGDKNKTRQDVRHF